MSKRKSSRLTLKPLQPKLKLASRFDCPLCHATDVVKCTIDKKHNFGVATCTICKNSFRTNTNVLSKPIDIYSEWIDDISKNY